jgi:hypothetical protein
MLSSVLPSAEGIYYDVRPHSVSLGLHAKAGKALETDWRQ